MPARGDHEVRRQQVVQIATDLIAAGGLAAATHRRIAEAAGCSTTVVSHYFADKRDLVDATYKQVGDRVNARLEAAADVAGDRLLAVLEALLPLDDDRRRDWRLLLAFLGLAATDAALTDEQQGRAAAARHRVQHVLLEEQRSGRVLPDVDVDAAARSLLSLALGIGMQALFDPDGWPDVRVRGVLCTAIGVIRNPGSAGATVPDAGAGKTSDAS
jgi:TetR/AcrR family transcriptional regulator, transcriptional repressor of bet genes